MNRRKLIAALGGVAASAPFMAHAQQSARLYKVAMFVPGSPETHTRYVNAFRNALANLGYEEGRNYMLNVHWGDGAFDHFSTAAAELVGTKPDVILATGSPVLAAIRSQTRVVPVVFVQVLDPVASGFVDSLAHPGGNLSGFTNYESAMTGKWLELLKEISPRLLRAALVYNPQASAAAEESFRKVFETAAASLSLRPLEVPFHDPVELDGPLAALEQEGAGGFVLIPDGSTLVNLEALINLAARHHLPVVWPFREFAMQGGLMSYGADVFDQYRRAAGYVDRILKGANPADLPVQTPAKFEMVINLKTVNALGLTISRDFMLRADEVIE